MIVEGFYKLLALIDYLVFKLASTLISVIIDIAGRDIFENTDKINDIVGRVYVVIGVLMLFKIVISAIQFLVNPDGFDDKEKGLGGLLKKTVISLALIVLVPAIFDFMMAIQGTIINTIPNIVFGNEAGNYYSKSTGTTRKTDETTDKMIFTVLSAFIEPNPNKGGSVDENAVDGIHDLESFRDKAAEDCGGGLVGDAGNCKYNYMIIISTLCGGFLCYVLLSMTLDVAIRTIKFSIIRILAPIPISGYIFSKDRLNKFAKTVMTVYFDLFIRLAIVYFIIFAVGIIMESRILTSMAGTDASWFRKTIVTIAIVGGLFAFAKMAPKFITELLGLPDIGSGDLKDMFKAPWQRYGGLAGAAAAPVRNSVANWRQAWKNNSDMVDSRGGKLRRAIQRARRVGNAGRHAIGGAVRGTADAFAGAAAGDDWAKMNERHRKASAASAKRSAEGYMKRTSNDTRQEVKDQRKKIEEEFKEQGIDINNFERKTRGAARQKVQQRMTDLRKRRSELQAKIAAGGTDAEMSQWKKELGDTNKELQTLSTKEGFAAAVNSEVKAARKVMISKVVDAKVKGITDQIDKNNSELATLQTELSSTTLSDSERKKKNARYAELLIQNDELNEKVRDIDATKAEMEKELSDDYDRRIQIREEKLEKAEISGRTIARGKVDQFFGGEGFTGSGYTEVADVLKTNRSNLWSGEAMTKLQQNPHILSVNGVENVYPAKPSVIGYTTVEYEVDSTGKPMRDASGKLVVKLDASGNPVERKYTYSEILDFKQQIATGQIKPEDIEEKTGFRNATDLEAAFKDIEKGAASDYVTMAARGDISNSTITESIARMKSALASSNIPKDEKNRLLALLQKDPGDFLKRASDIQERMRTRGSRISAYNSGKKDS